MKKKLMKLSILGSLLAATLLSSGNVSASCYASAYQVERVIAYDTYGYIYLRPAGALTNSFYYYIYTTSDKILSTAANAHTDSSRVNILGNATVCPTAGTARHMGTATYIYITE